eukprot:COSAG05_NODE_297_length_11939_cov_17.362753_4_plen_44_part_00
MRTVDGIELLHKYGITPEAIYIDASHHYEDVIDELQVAIPSPP